MATLLSAQNLVFAYGDRPVLREVSLQLAPGEVVALLGPNGSGKSTLIRTLLGQLPAQGAITWDEKPLHTWPRRDLARLVAYLAQSPAYEPEQTVADVLRTGRAPYWSAFGIESPRDLRVVQETSALLGLDDLLARAMAELSGGQRQRVFIGRCLVQEPKALLLDEPNTFLDLRHQVELGKLIRTLARERGLGVLMASHDLNLAGMFADRLALLHEGRLAAVGSADEVLQPQLLEEVYGLPMQRIASPAGTPMVYPVIR